MLGRTLEHQTSFLILALEIQYLQGGPPEDFIGCDTDTPLFLDDLIDHTCGGSLLNHLYLVTTKHCVQYAFLEIGCFVQTRVSILLPERFV